ncbi:hypothetical protein OROGR_012680 [Orobanche gracilis]
MEVPESSALNNVVEEYYDALDEFTFYDCFETFSETNEPDGDASISVGNPNPSPGDKDLPRPCLRRRRSHSHHKSSGADSMELSKSPVNLENYLRERKLRSSRKNKKCANKSENLEIEHSSECLNIVPSGEKDQTSAEHSTITNANAGHSSLDGLARDDSNLRVNQDTNSRHLLTLTGTVIKCITFQIYLLVTIFMFPIWLVYYLYMLAFNPFGLLKICREYLFQKIITFWKFIYEIVSKCPYKWLEEHQSVWKLGLKCGWGLLWSSYVCVLLVGLLLSAFVMSGIIIRVMVEEPIRMKRSLNFDYKEKSPVAFVPITTSPESIHSIYLREKSEKNGKDGGLRVIPANHKLKVTVSLTLPESEYNQNLGIFQVRVDFLSADGKVLAMSRRPCMLQFKSKPIRLLLTFIKVAPILTGYTSETQNLKINFRGFTEGETPTECLRLVIEQRAEFLPGAGIPEIYSAFLTLESELTLMKKVLWFWRKTLFVWVSMAVFAMELLFALLCCRPIVIPNIHIREATTNRDDSQNDRSGQSQKVHKSE